MFIVNDIELLKRLGRHKILDFILTQCKVAISAVRLTDYSLVVKREIEQYPAISICNVDERFSDWTANKRRLLSLGDLSSIYATMANKGSTLVVSEEDMFVEEVCTKNKVVCIRFDEFIIMTIKDERIIQLYNLIKVA